ncbi:MAG: energy transducer TonB [Thermoanaerobaculia bacterium]
MKKKPCVRCERLVDPVARLCPYCNWDQGLPPPRPSPITDPSAEDRDEVRDRERRRTIRRILVAAGVVVALVATFAIGGLVTRIGKKAEDKEISEVVPSNQDDVPTSNARQLTDLRLVPSSDLTTTVNRSITSAPLQTSTAVEDIASDRSDTTALPSQQYVFMEERAAAERERQKQAAAVGVDPRSIRPEPAPRPRPTPQPTQPQPAAPQPPAPTATREEPPSRPAEPPTRRETVTRTRPEPISQPLPDISTGGTARFRLRIGPDGSVRDVEVIRTIPGATTRLVQSIQRWKFRPATENGRPVEGIHLVDLTFKGDNDD